MDVPRLETFASKIIYKDHGKKYRVELHEQ